MLCPVFRSGDPELAPRLRRRPALRSEVTQVVSEVIRAVEERGAEAVLEHTRRFDSSAVEGLMVTQAEFDHVTLIPEDAEAIETAIERVAAFHRAQLESLVQGWEEVEGGWMWGADPTDAEETGFEGQRMMPLGSVGLYAPGGQASYPSSVVMNAVPAQVAGVKRLVLATPSRLDGSVHPAVLHAARALGIETVLKAGGASAIAAMALGWEGFEPVDKVAGPGNAYVNEAKRQLWGSVGVDLYAGPSEVAVVVDGSCEPAWAAADLLTQIEHSADNVALLVGTSEQAVRDVLDAAERLLHNSPRAEVMRAALRDFGMAVIAESLEEACEIVDRFAPEHASAMVEDTDAALLLIRRAGCLLLGPHTPQGAGDYCAGPSHTLPTSSAARFASPLNVMDFLRVQSVGELTSADLGLLSGVIQAFGRMEGLPMHAEATRLRG